MGSQAADDTRWMALALAEAARGFSSTRPNPRVGCVIVRDGELVASGFHHHAGGPHAERVALAAAGPRARGATAYVTLEPCCHHGRTPPCTEGLIEAGVARVVHAARDPNPRVDGGGTRALQAAGITVMGEVLAEEARALNRGFFSRHERGRPWLTLKLGMSLDGRTALANGASQWITGEPARADVQRLRAGSCAVMTGVGTVLADDPRLDVRDPAFDLGGRPPLRVVLDGALRTPPSARVIAGDGNCVVFTSSADPVRAGLLEACGARVVQVASANGQLDLQAVLAHLGALEVNELLVEAGPRLAASLLDQSLIDELIVYLAPVVLGGDARAAFATRGLLALADARRWKFVESAAVGCDLRLTLTPPCLDASASN